MSIIPKLKYPNVPNMLGVPKLARALNANPVTAMILGKIEGELWRKLTTESRWGIYKDGKPYLLADTVVDLGVSASSKVATYPQASIDGNPVAFASYNKVNDPNEYRVRLAKGGSLTLWGGRAEDDRRDFLGKLEQAKQSVDLFDVVTPEKVYKNCALESYDYRREQQSGAYMLIVDVTLKEVRTVDAKYSKETIIAEPQSVNGEEPSSNGQTQGQTVDNSKQQSLAKRIETGNLNKEGLQKQGEFIMGGYGGTLF